MLNKNAALPRVEQSFYPMTGGLDLMTPPISVSPGKCFDAQNYEPEISGGYRRIDGFERFDGRPSPTLSPYAVLPIALSGSIPNGSTVTGLTSGATGRALGIYGTTLVLGRTTGIFSNGEAIQVAAVTQATTMSTSVLSGATLPSDDADYKLLAANDIRLDILVVPGSGPIRGVWIYKDVRYAFRDNAGGTAGNMWKATSGGWVQIVFPTEIAFSSATGGATSINVGDTIANTASAPTKTATVLAVLTRTGSWGTNAVGTLVITPVSGSFVSTDPLFVGSTQKAVATAGANPITRAPGGTLELENANFTGSTLTQKMYGVDGMNPCFEFDGTTYVSIHTGMALDTPLHLRFHRNFLFLSFLGSAQYSALGNPYGWTAILGAGELTAGDQITGFLPQGGNVQGSSLAIFTKGKTSILYGSSSVDFRLVMSIFDLGYSDYTIQPVSNTTYGLTARGVQGLITTLTYGDFDFASITHEVQTMITAKRGLEIASNSSRTKDQYRLYWSDGTGLAIGLTGDQISGVMPINYGKPVRCITTAVLASGAEATYFGSDDGYVYQDNTGTSFDGLPIEAWIRPVFNHLKSPRVRKRYRRATFEVRATGYAQVNITADLGYATADVLPAAPRADSVLVGAGGYWDQLIWDQFTWDTTSEASPSVSVEGTEKNISFLFYSNRAQDKPHTVQGVNLTYSIRRNER